MNQKHLLLLFVFSLVIYFVGNENLIVTDPTESNYAETAREMLAAGDFLSPRIYGHYWFDKPIMYYLELIISFKLFGMNNFAVRFFPALMASATLFLTYAFGAYYLGAKRALVAALFLGTTVAYYYIGHAAITDTTMVFFAATAIMSFYRRYTGGSLFWQYLAFFLTGYGGANQRAYRHLPARTYNFIVPCRAPRAKIFAKLSYRARIFTDPCYRRSMVCADAFSPRLGLCRYLLWRA